MALPSAYLTTAKNLEGMLNAIKTATAPPKFTQKFLESLEFKSSSDRLMIGVLKALRFLTEDGKPTDRYYQFLDQTQSARVLAEGVREAYADLFSINTKAYALTKDEVLNKFRTLSQGQLSENVLPDMALTFTSLVKYADFGGGAEKKQQAQETPPAIADEPPDKKTSAEEMPHRKLGGLVYNIQIVLPESRDAAVYDALFKSLKDHLL